MVNVKKYIHIGILFVICHSHYIENSNKSLCPQLNFIEMIKLGNLVLAIELDRNLSQINQLEKREIQVTNCDLIKKKKYDNILINLNTEHEGKGKRNKITKLKLKDRRKYYKSFSNEEQILICQDILYMNMKNKESSEIYMIKIPLNLMNITSLLVLFIFIIFGSLYIWKIMTKKKCLCKLCKNEYLITEKLSEGGFGEIFKVEKNNFKYILKRCKTEDISEADDILAEAKYLRNLEHKNIVKYIDDFIHIEFNRGKIDPYYYVIIVMEYCEGGDLKKLIDERYYTNNKFTRREIIEILAQLCDGFNYLHTKNIIHRDIKSQNIFLTKEKVLRIGDFGLAKKIKKNKRNSCMTIVGTDCYMAPEVVRGEKYGKPADVWSLGCIVYELCTLNFMWMLESPIGITAMTKSQFLNKFLEDVNDKEYNCVKKILRSIFIVDSNKRIKIETIAKKLRKERRLMNAQIGNSTNNLIYLTEDVKEEDRKEI